MIDLKQLDLYQNLTAKGQTLKEFEENYYRARRYEIDFGHRQDILNITATIGEILRYIAELEAKVK